MVLKWRLLSIWIRINILKIPGWIDDLLLTHTCIGREMLQPRVFTKLVVLGENLAHKREAAELGMGLYEVHRFNNQLYHPQKLRLSRKMCSVVVYSITFASFKHTLFGSMLAIWIGLFFTRFESILSSIQAFVQCCELCVTQFRGGATQHGPKPRSHEIGLQKQVRRLGLKVALSSRVAEGKVWSSILYAKLSTFRLTIYVAIVVTIACSCFSGSWYIYSRGGHSCFHLISTIQ